ncbi:hypothetical protein DZJ_09030 [Dickeya ananatis]
MEFIFNVQPLKIYLNDDGAVCGVGLIRTEMGEPDASGRRRPKPVPGSEFVQPADAVITAFGFQTHSMPWLQHAHISLDRWGHITTTPVDDRYPRQTSHRQVFAGGDAVRGADLVVTAIADGRKAAQGMLRVMGLESQDMSLPVSTMAQQENRL